MTEEKKKKNTFSPILDAILHGGSGVALNMVDVANQFNRSKCLFKSSALNDSIIFKFPNFQEEISEASKKAFGGQGVKLSSNPIETGIYLPYSTDAIDEGGCAIYLRQKNYKRILLDTIGSAPIESAGQGSHGDITELPDNIQYDLKLLDILDSVPTLDPFLLKECLDSNGVIYDSSILRLDPNEESEIKQLISGKISPIIQKAFESANKRADNHERLLLALWDPTMPEAKAFVHAFGINESETSQVFSAWKGITFYQLQARATAPKLKEMLEWLKSKDAMPFDAVANKAYMPQLQMYNNKIVALVNQNIAEMRTIIQKYDSSFGTFIAGSPHELVSFLRSVRRIYYLMGYCISSLKSAAAIFVNVVKPPDYARLNFDDTNTLYTRLDTTLSRRRDVPATF